MSNVSAEIGSKLQKLGSFLDQEKLDGVLLWQRNNFAWVTGGANNFIPNNSPIGVTAIYATREKIVCVANTIEAPRMRAEETGPRGIETLDYQWWNPADETRLAKELFGGKRIATDGPAMGLDLRALPASFAELRYSLLPEEIERFKDLGRRASDAMERACRAIKPGMTEHEIAGLLDYEIHKAGTNPVVTLISTDERVTNFRHPIPTDRKLEKYVMLVTCAEQWGLIANLTRFVHFGPLSEDQKKRQQATANIDAAVNLATKPGRTVAEVFEDLQKAYADNGHDGQWKYHHQGGPCGYAGREAIANPTMNAKVLENQAFAWNPSIVGHKSEDTVVVSSTSVELISSPSNDWPSVMGESQNGTLRRADILVR